MFNLTHENSRESLIKKIKLSPREKSKKKPYIKIDNNSNGSNNLFILKKQPRNLIRYYNTVNNNNNLFTNSKNDYVTRKSLKGKIIS